MAPVLETRRGFSLERKTNMEIISPYVEMLGHTVMVGDNSNDSPMKLLELAIRNCYKSESKIKEGSWKDIINIILQNNHLSTLEHVSFTFRVVTSRDVLQEVARHRIASYSVESTRYCNYSPDKKGMKFILPAWISEEEVDEVKKLYDVSQSSPFGPWTEHVSKELIPICVWYDTLINAEKAYNILIEKGWKPQQARVILPGDLKTEIIMTFNIRSMLNFLEQRTKPGAHPDMIKIAKMIQTILQFKWPLIFDREG